MKQWGATEPESRPGWIQLCSDCWIKMQLLSLHPAAASWLNIGSEWEDLLKCGPAAGELLNSEESPEDSLNARDRVLPAEIPNASHFPAGFRVLLPSGWSSLKLWQRRRQAAASPRIPPQRDENTQLCWSWNFKLPPGEKQEDPSVTSVSCEEELPDWNMASAHPEKTKNF